jgi:hypothetical protein
VLKLKRRPGQIRSDPWDLDAPLIQSLNLHSYWGLVPTPLSEWERRL